ncbi:zinc-finger domain-containing protein [Paenibacillus psychroresistens]|uniref:Zinc-finger domain-containing protein n=1 Tax=Paenibacillus psychroresistens TaxID=1778678 RepID=A0A6B8RUR2_9BACL|nr:zinc-finger domain-containing protein [Paenibacillus psychroresistens]
MRNDALNQINKILDTKCNGCPIKIKLTAGCKGNYAPLEKHCKTICEHGTKLRELGGKLGRGRDKNG